MNTTELIQNIKKDFLYSTLPQTALETTTVGILSLTSSNKKALFRDLGRSVGATTTAMVGQNAIEFALINYYLKKRNQNELDFQSLLTCRVISTFSSKTVANIIFLKRKDAWTILFSPIFHGIGSGLFFICSHPQQSLNYFKSRFPRQYDQLVQIGHDLCLDQVYQAMFHE